MNCAISSASAPATISTFPPTDADCSTSGGLRPCWPSCKPHDPALASSQHRRYLLARALTEPDGHANSPGDDQPDSPRDRSAEDRSDSHRDIPASVTVTESALSEATTRLAVAQG